MIPGVKWHNRALGQLRRVTHLSAYLGSTALLACVAITVSDVVLRNFFAGTIRGALEITQLCIMWAAFLTIPLGFAHGNHISVEVVLSALPRNIKGLMQGLFTLIGAAVLLAYLWWGGAQAVEAFERHELTSTIGIPIWLYWVPVLFGMALSAACAVMVAFGNFDGSFTAHQEGEI